MSGFYFIDHNDPTPPYPVKFGQDSACPYASNSWSCEQRWRPIRNMAKFRAVVADTPLDNWRSDNPDRIAFSRGNSGFFALNNDPTSPWISTFQTGLAAGNYCDIISGDYNKTIEGGNCSGTVIKVNTDGNAEITVPSGAENDSDPIVALHRSARIGSRFQRTVIFMYKVTDVTENVFIRGGIDFNRGKGNNDIMIVWSLMIMRLQLNKLDDVCISQLILVEFILLVAFNFDS